MKGLITCHIGFEDVLATEVKELINKQATIAKGHVLIEAATYDDLAYLAFHSQAAHRVCVYLGELQGDDITIDEQAFKEFFTPGCSYGVKAVRQEETSLQSTDIAAEVGHHVGEYATGQGVTTKVNLTKPDVLIHAIGLAKVAVFGIDLVGTDMGKRPYKVVNTNHSLNGSFAYGILRKLQYEKRKVLLDPFCHTGIFMIEAALHQTGRSVFYYEHEFTGFLYAQTKDAFTRAVNGLDELSAKDVALYGYADMLKTVKSAEKNAKIAGVHDQIKFSKVTIDWIDAKFDEESVDLILSYPPQVSKRAQNQKDIEKVYDELFYQAKYLLTKKGELALLLHATNGIDKKLLTQHQFVQVASLPLSNGGQEFMLCTFRRT